MAPKQVCAKYQYVVTPAGPKILPVEEPSCKDEESPADYNAGGYLPVKVNDTFKHGRYRVIRKLGWGHFSTVWLVRDTQTQRHSALKVVKSAGRYAETARDEIKLLSQVSSYSPTHPGRSHIVSFLDSFLHQGPEASHVCIVFEPLGENLLALIERNKKKGVPKALVKVIARQILLGLQYLHDECDLVHTDIKPENILISIPDIEAHIHNELSQSPSPTSRRVGVPLPTKSRAGVSIPYNQQRTRRQVQIFDSQPLASPGRSSKGLNVNSSTSTGARQDNSGSGSNSQSSSYIAQMQLTRLASAGNLVTYASGTAISLSSSAPRVSSGLSSSAPFVKERPKKTSADAQSSAVPSRLNAQLTSTSTSSSSSSIYSALASTTVASSIVSTPPTSLSNSIGNVVSGIMAMTIDQNSQKQSSLLPDNENMSGSSQEFRGLPMNPAKGKGRTIGSGLETVSMSWKYDISVPPSSSHNSSFLSANKANLLAPSTSSSSLCTHSRSYSGLNTSYWQDPGTAPPAPAVLVSAVVGADGQNTSPLKLADISTNGGRGNGSNESSVTIIPQRPSYAGTLSSLSNGRTNDALSVTSSGSSKTTTRSPDLKKPDPSPMEVPSGNSSRHTSLLTQTAPPRTITTPDKHIPPRNTPPRQVSQLSAHMHTQFPPSPEGHLVVMDEYPDPKTRKNDHKPPPISPTSVTPTPTSPTPAAPPPTPATSPTTCVRNATTSPSVSASPLPPLITADHSAGHHSPPISIKIADLGNATPSKKHYTEDIQTRQYRSPEAILGKHDWDARVDIWSVACVIFELLTAEYLFDPQGQGELFTKDDDHMAQIIELLGDFAIEVKMGGKYSRELFDHSGSLRYIRTLKPWPLKRVMTEKYLFSDADAAALCAFLEPMLQVDMRGRTHARDMANHAWLEPSADDSVITDW